MPQLFQIDDFFEYKSGEVANLPLLTDTTYEAYFGGIPGEMDLMSGVTAHKGSYIGCIRDLVLLEEYVDWEAEATLTGATLNDCDVQPPVSLTTTEAPWIELLPPPSEAPAEYDPRQVFPDVQFGQEGVDTQGSCRLPVSPALDPDLDINSGLRFGTKDGSYIEYVKKNLPAMMVDQNRFQIEFKTTSSEGLIFFMVHEEGKTDFIALFVKGGKLVYSFNCGSGASKLATNFRVDDGKWHSVEFSRVAKHGKLVFDSIEVKVEAHNRASLGSTTNLEVMLDISDRQTLI